MKEATAPAFTPGPWFVDIRDDEARAEQRAVITRDGMMVASSGAWRQEGQGGDQDEIDRANARLIAAAPELYEALNDFVLSVTFIDDGSPPQVRTALHNAWDSARAALAKANGRG